MTVQEFDRLVAHHLHRGDGVLVATVKAVLDARRHRKEHGA